MSTVVDAVVVRPLVAADLDAVADIEARSTIEPWSRSLFAGELRLPDGANQWLVAEEAGSVIGFAGVMVMADDAHVMNIAVDPDRRREGLGAMLLERVLRAAADRGATAATLEVRPDNRAARALYRRFGFRRAGKHPGYYADGSDAMIMWTRTQGAF